MTDRFPFVRPEEAPVFTPTEDEFKDPLAYINKIRPQAEAAGICKIKPPANWQPPFAVDVDSFKFTPRVQRLNELEAKTRIKLNFLDQIAKFWELQGSSLKIPTIEKKAVDLYTLHKLVKAEGGKDKVNNDKKWNRLAARMGHNPQKCYGALLKSHYEKILFPYDMFKKKEPHLIPGEKSESPKKGPSSKFPAKSIRMGGKASKQVFEHIEDKLAKYVCHICNGGDAEEKMLLCDGCDDSYHTFCLQPPLPEVPKGDWRCPRCVAEEVSKPSEAFGFEQAQREYTLQQFGEMADQFKSDYFNMPVHMVTSELVEKEFWRIVSAIDEDVTVEYGADLHTMDHGSGFPTGSSNNIEPQDAVYCRSGWNLNNLPVLQGSVLGHINADISGMKVPWMYVGMCFATFCWHNEDHWSYSINYLHWGEPKTWYGVPGCRANDFEIAMKQAAPELFQSQPDLLHQLVTIMNPNILMQAGVPVYRMDQKAGEFIVTFPRAYHAGFNQGYNFAEAVNFAPADWLAMGRDCITHYSNLRRYCVFSHDELICKMAHDYDKLDQWIAVCTYKDMTQMLETERELRRVVLSWGLTGSERVAFEMLPDDSRLCEFCKTTCFLSAITCPCTEDQLVCLRHYDKLCKCPSETHILKYRYTLDEIPLLIKKLQDYTSEYENWSRMCKEKVVFLSSGMKQDEDEKIGMEELRDLVEEAKKNNYPNSQLVETVKQVALESEKLSKIAKSLLTSSVRTRKSSTAPSKPSYSVSELQVLLNDLNKLPVKIKEAKLISKLINKLNEINTSAKYYLSKQETSAFDSKQIKTFLDEAMQLDVEIPDLQEIQIIYKRLKWLESVGGFQGEWNVNQLKLSMEIGESLPCHKATLSKLKYLSSLNVFIDMWEEKAQRILNAKKEKFTLEDVESVLGEAVVKPVALPSLPPLRELVLKTNVWLQKVKLYENKSEYPYIDDLENLVTKGEAFPLFLKPLNILRSQVHGTKLWKEMCARAFLKKNSCITLIEALVPRKEISEIPGRGKRKRFDVENPNHQLAAILLDVRIPDLKTAGEIAKAYEKRQAWEMEEIIALRKRNLEKKRQDIGDAHYCVCQKPFGECMIRCELCYEWFHATCVPLPLLDNAFVLPEGITSQAYVAYRIAVGEIKYFGPCCGRSKRPKLDTILDLLVKLQKLPVKIVEGEAIHCLTQRAMCWMDKAKEFLSCEEIVEALKIIKASKSNTTGNKRRNSESMKYREYGEMPIKIKNETSCSGSINNHDNFLSDDNNSAMESMVKNEGDCKRPVVTSLERLKEGSNPASNNVLKKKGIVLDDLQRIKISGNLGGGRKSCPISKNFQKPVIRLAASRTTVAENLLVEAGLMEVSVECESSDISDDIWRIVESSKPKPILDDEFSLQKVQEVLKLEIAEKQSTEPSDSLSSSSQTGDSKRIIRKPIKRKLQTSLSVDEEDTTTAKASAQEYDDDCAARPCKQPSGKGIDWVQCDAGCDLWFHLICVGLKKSQVKKLDTFICQACAPKDKANQKAGDSDGWTCDTDSKMSESGKTSICSNKENDNANIDNCSLPPVKMEEEDKCLYSL